MRYIECPATLQDHETSLFLAGGITGCGDWQQEIVKLLSDQNITLLNPRRAYFPKDNPKIDEEQIEWEYKHFRKATAVLFWFTPPTLNPITLFELGQWSVASKPLFVGVHPDYARKRDVEIQMGLAKPQVTIYYSLPDLARSVIRWIDNGKR